MPLLGEGQSIAKLAEQTRGYLEDPLTWKR
jgi:hypothetical protein